MKIVCNHISGSNKKLRFGRIIELPIWIWSCSSHKRNQWVGWEGRNIKVSIIFIEPYRISEQACDRHWQGSNYGLKVQAFSWFQNEDSKSWLIYHNEVEQFTSIGLQNYQDFSNNNLSSFHRFSCEPKQFQ